MPIFFLAARAPRLDLHPLPRCDFLRVRIVFSAKQNRSTPASYSEPEWRGRHGSGGGLVCLGRAHALCAGIFIKRQYQLAQGGKGC
eukprot:2874360-Lingulodinium_polyedra.AAC.1